MKFLVSYFAIFGIFLTNLAESKKYDFFNPDETLGKQEYFEHRGLKVYFFSPLHNSDVDKVVIGNQGVWTRRPGQTLTKVVGFFRCMGFGLSHVSYFKDDGETKELLLGYSHGDDDLVVFDKERFYAKLVDYTNTTDKFNPDVPGHPVLHQLEHLLKHGAFHAEDKAAKVRELFDLAKKEAEKRAEEAKAKEVEVPEAKVPLVDEVHAEL